MTALEKTAFAKHKAQTLSCMEVMSGRTINYKFYDATRKKQTSQESNAGNKSTCTTVK